MQQSEAKKWARLIVRFWKRGDEESASIIMSRFLPERSMSFTEWLLSSASVEGEDHKAEGKLVIRDYDTKYAPVVAKAYEARPVLQNDARASWEAAMQFIETQFRQIKSRLKVEFVETDPYQTYEEMRDEVDKSGVLKVWTGASDDHPLWTPDQNWMFRTVHDYQSHLAGGHRFGLKGELASYNRHIKTFPKAAYPCLFTEIVGQTSVTTVTGDFPKQKAAILYGFDYVRVGDIDAKEFQKNFDESDTTLTQASRNGSFKPEESNELLEFVKQRMDAMGFETLLKSSKERRKKLDALNPPLRTGRVFDPYPGRSR